MARVDVGSNFLTLLRSLSLLCVLFIVIGVDNLKAQTADPVLPDGVVACNGSMAVKFDVPTPGTYLYMHLKVYMWGNATVEAYGKFKVYKFNPHTNRYERVLTSDPGYKLQEWLNGRLSLPGSISLPGPVQHAIPGWWRMEYNFRSVDLGFNQSGAKYLIRNTGGVFHFGITVDNAVSVPATYSWLSNQQNYDAAIDIRQNGVVLPKNGLGEYVTSICKGADIALSAEVMLQGGGAVEDYFRYDWTGLWGIQPPLDSSHVRAEELVANPVRVEVKRLGMCAIEPSAVLEITTLDRPTPTIDFPSSPVCVQTLGMPELVQLTPRVVGVADKVDWYFQVEGADGHWIPIGSETVVPPAPFTTKNYSVNYTTTKPIPNNVTEGLPVTHHFRLVASNGACEGSVVREIKVYPPIAQPVLEVNADKPDGCSPVEVRVRNKTKPSKSGLELWLVVRPGSVLAAPDASSHGVPEADILATHGFENLYYTFHSVAPTTEIYNIRYIVRDKTGSCLRYTDEPVSVKPLIEAKFDLEVLPAVAGGLPCSPVNVTARDKSVGTPVQWDWKVWHNGISHSFGQFGGGVQTGIANEPAFSVLDDSPLEVELTVQNGAGCVSSKRLPLLVYPLPSALLTVNPIGSDCLPIRYQVQATNIGYANDYRWWVRSATETKPLGDPGQLSPGQTTIGAEFFFDNESPVLEERHVVLELNSRMGCVKKVEAPIAIPPKLESRVVVVGAENAGCPDVNGKRVVRLRDESVYPLGPPPVNNPSAIREWYLDGNPIPVGDIVQVTATEWDLTLRNLSTTLPVENTLALTYTIAAGTPQECKSQSELKLLTYPRIALAFDGFHHAKSSTPQPWLQGQPGAECALVDAQFVAAPSSGAGDDLVWRIFTGSDTVHSAIGSTIEVPLDNRTAGQIEYTVRLRGRSSGGECSSHVDQVYVVNPRAEARMEFTTLDDCTPYRIKLVNTTIADPNAPYVAQWFLDGGVEMPANSGEYVYTTPGEKRVKLMTTYGACVSESQEQVFTVLPPVSVNVGLISSDKLCAPAPVEFQNNSTGVTKMLWYFERLASSGGANSDSPVEIAGAGVGGNPVHTYANKGEIPLEYQVLVRGENQRGCPQETSVRVSIYPEPIPNNSYNVLDPCTPFKLRFESKSPVLSDYVWTFTPVGKAAAFGQHIVEAGTQSGPVELELPNAAPNDSLSYRIEYEGWKQWPAGGPRCEVARKGLGMVRVPPLLNPIILPKENEICSGASVIFEDKSTGGAVKQLWDFGDGTVDEGPKLVPMLHKFVNTRNRDHQYIVRVESHQLSSGCTRSIEVPILVHPEVKAIFAHGTPEGRGCEYPLPVEFINRSVINEEISEVQSTDYKWEYGYSEGGLPVEWSTGSKDPHIHFFKISHLQNESEQRTVKLTTTQTYTSGMVCSSNTTRDVIVWQELRPSFTVDVDEGCLPVAVQFSLTGKPDIAGIQNVFDFGDGTTSEILPGTVRLVEHLYNDFSLTNKKIYTVRMTMSDKRKCSATFERTVAVHPKLEARFTLDRQQYCSPDRVRVTNESIGGTQYAWTVDIAGVSLPDTYGREPFDVNVVNPFSDRIKSHVITLLATQNIDGFECTSTYEQRFDVYPEVKPDFEPSVLFGCNPLRVEIDNKSTGLGQYHWFVDGVDRSKEDQPVFLLSHDDTERGHDFEIRLRATNPLQCSAEMAVNVHVYPLVESFFNLDAIEGCTPMFVFGTAQSVSPAYSYQWDIPQGTPSTSNQITTGRVEIVNNSSPARPLNAKVRLRTYLTDNVMCFAEQEKEVTVHPVVRANFDGIFEGCNPYLFVPQNTSEVYNSGSATWLWSTSQGLTLGDQNPELRLVNTSKEQDHHVSVTLKVTSDKGCSDEIVKQVTVHPTPEADFRVDGKSESCTPFNVLFLNTSAGTDLKYTFNFGDGTSFFTKDRTTLLHKYENLTQEEKSFEIKLQVETDFGCKDETKRAIIVYPAAHASFDFEPLSEGCSPLKIQTSNKSTGGALHKWDFGDGGLIDMFEPDHIFWNNTSSDLTFKVKLLVSTSRDCRDSLTKEVRVFATPVARFEMEPSLLVYPASSVTYTNLSEPQPINWIYKWDFGDGHVSHVKDPGMHDYAGWGPKESGFVYTVKLSVEAERCTDEVEQLLYLYAPLPEGSFTSEQNEGCAPMRVFFENNVQYANQFLWEFDDGEISNDIEPIHVFEQPGTYNVKLTATGDAGTSYFYGIYVVHEPPEASFTIHPDKVMLPLAVVKMQPVISSHIKNFYWDFGDGITSTLPAPIHQYESAGEYIVRLRVESGDGCFDTISSTPVIVLSSGKLLFPNAFRPSEMGPNGGMYEAHDRKNEVFHPYTDGISRYTLYIYNRWGELIYQSNDVQRGWDGYRNGVMCKSGVYGWRAVGTFYNGEIFDERGNVTLLK